jgi:lauroyl/myristoyl acyltransferase
MKQYCFVLVKMFLQGKRNYLFRYAKYLGRSRSRVNFFDIKKYSLTGPAYLHKTVQTIFTATSRIVSTMGGGRY